MAVAIGQPRSGAATVDGRRRAGASGRVQRHQRGDFFGLIYGPNGLVRAEG